jgi:putative Mn2+ efflux pump MntP
MSGGPRTPTRPVLVTLAVLWLCALVLGFVTQTTELFGARGSALSMTLLGVASVGFVTIGALGCWIVLRWLADDERTTREAHR